MRFSTILVAVPVVAGATLQRREPAPLFLPNPVDFRTGGSGGLIDGQYIVKFKDGIIGDTIKEFFKSFGSVTPSYMFDGLFSGFAAPIDAFTLQALRFAQIVDFVEQDSLASGGDGLVSQAADSYGLARISSRDPYTAMYQYDSSAGEGTCSYIIDTGIDDTHPGFGGRAKQIKSFIPGQEKDGVGHGTHVAGIIGSDNYGVARKTNLYGVKVLNDTNYGPYSGMIAGLNFVVEDADKRECPNGVFVNFSIYGSPSRAMNDAVKAIAAKGYFIGVCAGNENAAASNYSPAQESSACVVGATDQYDRRYIWSNTGPEVDLMAPGCDIPSLWPGGGIRNLTGTSMATPFVVGLAAYLGTKEKRTGTEYLCERMKQLATQGAIGDQDDSTTNLLAYNGISYDK